MNNFGRWLKQSREDRNWSQDDLADKAKVSKTYISLLENAKVSAPRVSSLEKIARALRVSMDEMRERAGLQPVGQASLDYDAEMAYLFEALEAYRKRDVLNIAKLFLDQQHSDQEPENSKLLEKIPQATVEELRKRKKQ